MPKNIVICCDGTDNKLTINENTNVLHLYSCLEKSDRQVTYYHPGVGTIAPSGARNWLSRKWHIIKDQVSASSLEENVKNAYLFLMDNYQDGDKIYLFGFSRGAYTVRMLSGLIEMFGLLQKGNYSHLRYALEIYVKGDKMFEIANAFRSRFSRKIDIHFIGIWDTVVAAGGLINYYKSFPYSRSLGVAKTIRHAISIDERRKHYDFYEVSESHTSCKQVLFAGVHSDVGGSYPVEGLSKLALEWMLGEASNHDLILLKNKVERYVYGVRSNYQKPDFTLEIHNSLTFGFKIFDFIPRARYKKNGWFYEMTFDFRLWPQRKFANSAYIHQSVINKIAANKYKPANLDLANNKHRIEVNQVIKYIK
ncbi:Uncharacterized alpha/beta hydrolase domain [Flavobacterium sp. CF108]|uniref:DUF2235 domain-containing protein n=1 Tax=unclassified Flavobacterium TaxID=196869 RepID=UPI0008B5B3AC|nr:MULTISPECIES: DUF2235 domain-containing protein [unclassified Flavobacterium]SEO18983.1 Uncharacterized alpha/beta hydrolase domain [Flavobacterium sp. fv08]SHG54191.1 Uncharacterized alpha/beta hydrolase domain [Flavobacterium sp. CF108]